LSRQPRVYLRAGSHIGCLEMSWEDFERLEHPVIAPIGVRTEWMASGRHRDTRS